MMIRNANRNISVAKGHGYEFSKVKFALDFVNKAGRNTTIEDWVNAYNYIKGTNEDAKGCKACKAAKFTAGVRNYAQYGYLTLLNEGYKQEDFLDKPEVVEEETTQVDNEVMETENGCETEKQSEPVVAETSPETCNDQEQVPELAEEVEKPVVRNKGGRPKKVKK